MENKTETFDSWALVELFGHQKIVGKVTEATLAGGAFIRVDVPDFEGDKGFTRYFGPGAIYSLNPIAEDVAQKLLRGNRNEPVKRFELPQIAEKVQSTDDDYEEDEQQHQDELDNRP